MIPLRLHSDFSLLKAMIPVSKYGEALKASGYQAAALTDFDCGFGWMDFYTQMIEHGLKPILGTCMQLSLFAGTSIKGSVSFTNSDGCIEIGP